MRLTKAITATLILLFLATAPNPERATAQETHPEGAGASSLPFGWGPFQAPTPLSPFQKLRMVFVHQHPVLYPAESLQFSSTLTWANLWIPPGRSVFMDVEAWSINEYVEYTFNDRVSVSLFLPFIFINGGFMDATIERFHTTFGLGNMDRDKHPRNNVRLEVTQKNGKKVRIVDSNGDSFWRRAPVLSFRVRLNALDSSIPLTAKASVDFPELETTTNIVAEDGRDYGLGLAGAVNISQSWSSTFSIGRTHLRNSKLGDQFELKNHENSLLISFDYSTSDDFAYIVQFSAESAVANRTNSGFDQSTKNLLLGCKWRMSGGSIIELAFAENVGISDNSADFALHGGYSVTL